MSSMLQSDCILKVKTTMLYLQKGGSKIISLNPLIFWAMLPIWGFMWSISTLISKILEDSVRLYEIHTILYTLLFVTLVVTYTLSYFIYKWYELYKQKNIVGTKKLIIAFIISAIVIIVYFFVANGLNNLNSIYLETNNKFMELNIAIIWQFIIGAMFFLTFFMPYVYLGYKTRQENEFIKTKINTKYFLHRGLFVCFVLFCLGFSIVFYGSSFVDLSNSYVALNISKSIPYRLDQSLYFLLWLLHEVYLQIKFFKLKKLS